MAKKRKRRSDGDDIDSNGVVTVRQKFYMWDSHQIPGLLIAMSVFGGAVCIVLLVGLALTRNPIIVGALCPFVVVGFGAILAGCLYFQGTTKPRLEFDDSAMRFLRNTDDILGQVPYTNIASVELVDRVTEYYDHRGVRHEAAPFFPGDLSYQRQRGIHLVARHAHPGSVRYRDRQSFRPPTLLHPFTNSRWGQCASRI